MRDNVKEIVRLASRLLPIKEPIVEVGALKVEGQEGFAGLRSYFPGKKCIVYDVHEGSWVDQEENVEKELSFSDNSVGTVISCDTLEHVYDVFRFINEMDRVLAPEGVFLLVSVMYFPIHSYPYDYWRFTPECFRRLLQKIGEPLVLTQGPSDFPHTVIGVVQKSQSLSPRTHARFAEAVAELPSNLAGRLWEPPGKTRQRSWGDKMLNSIRKRLRISPKDTVPDDRRVPPCSMQTLLGDSAFDAALSRRFHESLVWEKSAWLGFPVQQFPTDLMALQELLYETRSRVIVECGTNKGGSCLFFASIMRLLHGEEGRVISIDISVEAGLRQKLDQTPLGKLITLLHGNSVSPEIFQKVSSLIDNKAPVLVFLDSHHSYAHVLAELNLYHSLVTRGSYLVVFDTICRYLAEIRYGNPDWEYDNPLRAVRKFLASHPEFTTERRWEKYMVTAAPYGFLRRI